MSLDVFSLIKQMDKKTKPGTWEEGYCRGFLDPTAKLNPHDTIEEFFSGWCSGVCDVGQDPKTEEVFDNP